MTECQIPELPEVGCLVPGPSPSPTPSPSATPTPTPSPTAIPTTEPSPEAPVVLVPAPEAPVLPGVLPGVEVSLAPTPVTVVPVASTQPALAAPIGVPLTTAVSNAYGIVVFGLIGVALLVSFLSGLRPALPGGIVKIQRTRLWAGLSVLAVAAIVGGLGWYRISGEPLLNRQIPFLASAGIAVVVLAVLGGALIVAEQLRADQNRIGELEDAVRALTDALAPIVEQPARRT